MRRQHRASGGTPGSNRFRRMYGGVLAPHGLIKAAFE
jgi:hypothetical protein